MAYGYWRPYVPVARRRAKAIREMEGLRKKGANIQPVRIAGRQIARTFWGMSWCEHLEKFSDYENRLPRGRSYVRNGSVCHLNIQKGRIAAKVSGSEIYDVTISVKALASATWKRVRESCAGRVASLLELLQGRLSDEVMRVVTDRDRGLFPRPSEITMQCSCPDWAGMCKHMAAVMYGIGSRLDERPELLFLLRSVDHNELISKATAKSVLARKPKADRRTLDEDRISEVFGIDLAPETTKAGTAITPPQQPAPPAAPSPSASSPRRRRKRARVPVRVLARSARRVPSVRASRSMILGGVSCAGAGTGVSEIKSDGKQT